LAPFLPSNDRMMSTDAPVKDPKDARERTTLRRGTPCLVVLSLLGLCVLAFIFGPQLIWDAFLRDMLFMKPPVSASILPVPPDAREVLRLDAGEGSKVVTFKTALRPDDVLVFYRETLNKDGWVNPLIDGDNPPDIFEWSQGGPDGPTGLTYRLTIITTVEPDGTKVVLNRITFDTID
jgi:hypothetical protein